MSKFVIISVLLIASILTLASSAISPVFGQLTEHEIKLSGNYFWGHGFGEQREGAVNNAKRDLIEKMYVRIESESQFSERDTNDEYFVELKSTTQTNSRIELRGLNYLPAQQRRDGTWESIAYLSKADFNRSINEAETQLLSTLSSSLEDERNGNINAAIPMYMDVLASTYFYPVSFYTQPDVNGEQFELRSFLNRKLSNWINSLTWDLANVRNLSTSSNTEFYFDLQFRYKDQPVSNVLVNLNKPGYPVHTIKNGMATIFYDYKPDELVERFSALLIPEIYPVIEEDKQEILANILPQRQISLEVDFSDIIDIDIQVNNEDPEVWVLYPSVKNLSVFDVQWMFKGESFSTNSLRINPAMLNTDTPVQLTLNASEKLSVIRILTPSGSWIEPTLASGIDELDDSNQNLILETKDVHFEIPGNKSEYIKQILRLKDGVRLTEYLNRLKSSGVLKEVGNKASMPDSDLSYLAIIKPENRKVEAVLSPVVEGHRTNLNNEKTIVDASLPETYAGMGSIWFQFN
ncbi:MAG: hypothetical protein JJ895_00425 [Balneolaceae bacterium]|nr:hypothetical protein [Balneolaceae bacterium]